MRQGRTLRPFSMLAVTCTLLLAGLMISGSTTPGRVDQAIARVAQKERIANVILELDHGQISGIKEVITDDGASNGRVVVLKAKERDFAHWSVVPLTANADLTIEMKKNSPYPFSGGFIRRGNQVFSSEVLADAKPGTYDYNVVVRDNKTGKEFKLDPPIRVDP